MSPPSMNEKADSFAIDADYDIEIPAGVAPESYYDSQLSPLRAYLRRLLLPFIRHETVILHHMQLKVRNAFLDQYFSLSAFSGTHTFFMIALPLLFWFGYSDIARGFTLIAALGVYWAGFFKASARGNEDAIVKHDYFCLPRPLSPPVVRLSRSKSTCLEYGFPSSHSTNAVSIALFLYSHILLTDANSWQPYTRELACFGLIVYAVSIVYGRLYCGMHSITDCVGGSAIGVAIWGAYWYYREAIEYYMVSPIWWDPVDDCPCFDDCVAFVAVLMGLIPGSIHFASTKYSSTVPVPATVPYTTELGPVKSILRMLFGIVVLFVWRMIAKKVLYVILPPIYKLFSLPYRPHFIPASTYNSLSKYPIGKVPSVIDLPSMTADVGTVGLQSTMDVHEKFSQQAASQELRARKGASESTLINESSENSSTEAEDEKKATAGLQLPHHHQFYPSQQQQQQQQPPTAKRSRHVKDISNLDNEAEALLRVERMHPPKSRFDVDIVSKLVVYAGIGALAVDGIPIMFELIGLGAPAIHH
ncbi:hypothetical protein DFQ26_004034 [Actinomortierella ambigua]|nr:hypothetical protein DFQ26_004034 [Actinomortierella ambigua]